MCFKCGIKSAIKVEEIFRTLKIKALFPMSGKRAYLSVILRGRKEPSPAV